MEIDMTEDEAEEIVGTIVLSKMAGAEFKVLGDPVKGQKDKLNVTLVLMRDKEIVWKVLLYKNVNRKPDLADLSTAALADVMPKAREFMLRAADGDRDLYLKGKLIK
jgi:hypothetical protein